MQQTEKSASEAKFGQDEHLATLVVCAGTHEVYKVCMSNLDQGGNLSLELFR